MTEAFLKMIRNCVSFYANFYLNFYQFYILYQRERERITNIAFQNPSF